MSGEKPNPRRPIVSPGQTSRPEDSMPNRTGTPSGGAGQARKEAQPRRSAVGSHPQAGFGGGGRLPPRKRKVRSETGSAMSRLPPSSASAASRQVGGASPRKRCESIAMASARSVEPPASASPRMKGSAAATGAPQGSAARAAARKAMESRDVMECLLDPATDPG